MDTILQYLSEEDLIKFRKVCRRAIQITEYTYVKIRTLRICNLNDLNNILQNPIPYRRLIISNTRDIVDSGGRKNIVQLLDVYKEIEHLFFHMDSFGMNDNEDNETESLYEIDNLYHVGFYRTYRIFVLKIKNLPNLKSLHVSQMNLLEIFKIIKANFYRLVEIVCYNCNLNRFTREMSMESFETELFNLIGQTSSIKVFKFGPEDKPMAPQLLFTFPFWTNLFQILAKSLKSLAIGTDIKTETDFRRFFLNCNFSVKQLKVYHIYHENRNILSYIFGHDNASCLQNTIEVFSYIGRIQKRGYRINLRHMTALKVCYLFSYSKCFNLFQ